MGAYGGQMTNRNQLTMAPVDSWTLPVVVFPFPECIEIYTIGNCRNTFTGYVTQQASNLNQQ